MHPEVEFFIPEETWLDCKRQIGFIPSSDVPPSASFLRSVASWLNPPAAVRTLSSLYASWVSTAELTIQTHRSVKAAPGVTRRNGPRFRVDGVHQQERQRQSHDRDVFAGWWWRLHTLLAGLERHYERGNGRRQRPRLLESLGKHVDDRPEKAHTILRNKEPSWRRWLQLFQQLRAWGGAESATPTYIFRLVRSDRSTSSASGCYFGHEGILFKDGIERSIG